MPGEPDTCTARESDTDVGVSRDSVSLNLRAKKLLGFELKSLILAQIERWRHALHMQVER